MNYRIKELLKDRNLNISELAEKINVQRESLSRIVNGASTSADTLQRIASALNVHISELFEKDTPNDNIIKCPNCGAELEVKKKEVK
uniref:helix-turn-helix domain-containing protein n=1 Tax=uncultured Dysgonomonas sp. TaxID=206096 RepID=UPI00261932F2|nr:helix-turn-helix transcriptional regulator [uncultured Dysgonomonas sp.]